MLNVSEEKNQQMCLEYKIVKKRKRVKIHLWKGDIITNIEIDSNIVIM